MPPKRSIGLALGGGGVKGLAHLGLLKILDRHQIKPDFIVGTSMGAILGALYASGVEAEHIEERLRKHIIGKGEKLRDIYKKRANLIRWAQVFSFEKSRGGFIAADGLFQHLFSEIVDLKFSDLNCAFAAVATDFHSGKEVLIESGDLLPAIQASMAVPGVFAPIEYKNNLLVDGGLVNNLACDHVFRKTDFRIASDVIALPQVQKPSPLQALSGSFSIMLQHATDIALHKFPPNFLFKVETDGMEFFDFHKIEDILKLGNEQAIAIESNLLSSLEQKGYL